MLADKRLDLNEADFTVTSLDHSSEHKRRKTISFKISTKKDVFNLLMNSELWAPFYKAEKMVHDGKKVKQKKASMRDVIPSNQSDQHNHPKHQKKQNKNREEPNHQTQEQNQQQQQHKNQKQQQNQQDHQHIH